MKISTRKGRHQVKTLQNEALLVPQEKTKHHAGALQIEAVLVLKGRNGPERERKSLSSLTFVLEEQVPKEKFCVGR